MKCITVAYDKNRLIGANNSLPWQGDMAADMRHFRESTEGNVVIMGRKTFDSIGKPLSNRQNIVITRQPLVINGVQVAHSFEEAYGQAEPNKTIYIIGGGQVYKQALSSVDQILATEIDATFEGDTYFPTLSDEWHEVLREDHLADENNSRNYSFVTYAKQQ